MSELLTVGTKFTRPARHMQPTMRIARRCAAALGATDGWTDRRTRHRFNTLATNTVRVINAEKLPSFTSILFHVMCAAGLERFNLPVFVKKSKPSELKTSTARRAITFLKRCRKNPEGWC